MSGSYDDMVNVEGKLKAADNIDIEPDDLYEAIEQMYGMIWYLADQIAGEQAGGDAYPEVWVSAAKQNSFKGLHESPGLEGRKVTTPITLGEYRKLTLAQMLEGEYKIIPGPDDDELKALDLAKLREVFGIMEGN